MRFVVLGAGAIGGTVGACLAQAGHDVLMIARGRHYETIAQRGLTFETPTSRQVLAVAVAPSPADVRFGAGDVLLIATKSQDTASALSAVRDAASVGLPIVCLQNGVENERVALRLFEHVYGALVMAPTAHLEPGVVQAYGTRLMGVIDVGRYPSGRDELADEVCQALVAARFAAHVRPDVMRFKYAKLVTNLGNAVDAICGADERVDDLVQRAREEGGRVLRAAGIEFGADGVDDLQGRWQHIGVAEIAGRPRAGSSTLQSLQRGAGFETDYLNGEIALLGRLHGVPAPVNQGLATLVARMAREGRRPGWMTPEQVLEQLA